MVLSGNFHICVLDRKIVPLSPFVSSGAGTWPSPSSGSIRSSGPALGLHRDWLVKGGRKVERCGHGRGWRAGGEGGVGGGSEG